nr:MAG TPA: acetyltransferase domain containing protein [Caudoviricetes sp.]
MEIASNFDAKLLTSIARDSESKQAVKDVSYASYITYKSKAKLYCEHTDNSFIIGTLCKKYFRIIGMATRSSHKHQGLAKKLLNRAIEFAKQCGYSRVYTRSHDGKDFYLKFGFEVIGDCGGDSLLILKI